MSDNPMYWPGHPRPAWHQQPPAATGQPMNSMSHYATHPGSMLSSQMSSDPNSLQMQSTIPARQPHQPNAGQPHQSTLASHPASLTQPPGAYPSMMQSATARPANSHLSATQGVPPPHPSLQQAPTHPQSQYSHQYSSLASSYWNPPPAMNSQPSLGPMSAPPPQQHSTSYPSPSQQTSSAKSNSNNMTQLKHMPSSGQNTAASLKSPTHRSTTSSPSTNAQQQLHYSYNSSGQGSYFSSSANSNQPSYYSQYDPSGTVDPQKSGWSTGQPINSMSHYATHPGNMLSGQMPSDPNSLQMQSSIPPRQPHQPTTGPPPGTYPNMMQSSSLASSATARPANSHLSATQGAPPPHPSLQQAPTHPQSQYSHQYSSLASSYWNPPPAMNSQPSLGPMSAPPPQQHSTSYPSPSQQTSSMKSNSNSLAQLEQMVMPGGTAQASTTLKSPTHRSATSSPSTNPQQLQYSYNSSGQGSYFSSSATSNQASYYPQYDSSSGVDVTKSGWSEQPSSSQMTPVGPTSSGPSMMDSNIDYNQPYDGSGGYGDYTQLSTPSRPRFTAPDNATEPLSTDKGDPYAIDSQTFDDYDEQSSTTKTKKGRAKKGDDSVKKERKPRAPRAPKVAQPQSPSVQTKSPMPEVPVQTKPLTPTFDSGSQVEPIPAPSIATTSIPSPNIASPGIPAPIASNTTAQCVPAPVVGPSNVPTPSIPTPSIGSPTMTTPSISSSNVAASPSKSPSRRMSTESPSSNTYAQPSHYAQGPSYQIQYEPPSEISDNVMNPSGPVMIESGTSDTYAPPVYDSTPSYTDYAQPDYGSTSETVPPAETSEEKTDQTPATKSKKSRPKKSDDKPKKERKPRAAKAPQPTQPEQSSSPLPLPPPSEIQPSTADDELADTNTTVIPPESSETPSLNDQAPLAAEPSESTETVEEKPDQTPTTKPSKSRQKKSEDRPKKERKSRAAKAVQPVQPEQSTPPPPQPEAQPGLAGDELADTSSAPAESTPPEVKPKRIRIRDSTSKGKKKLPKFALKFAKTKKRKRLGSSDNEMSDLDKTPPPSPDEVESGVQKRRSARNTKKLKYNDDIELGFSDSDDESQILPKKKISANTTADGDTTMADESVVSEEPTVFAAPVEDTMVVEKIMASRMGQRELEPEPGEVLPPDGTHIEVEEFYVKYKNMSYLHCDWRTVEELEKGDRRVVQKIKRYKQKKDSSNIFSFMDEEPFDPQYCEVDRILAVNEVEEMVPDSEGEEEKETQPTTTAESAEPKEAPDQSKTEEKSGAAIDKPTEADTNETTTEKEADAITEKQHTVVDKEDAIGEKDKVAGTDDEKSDDIVRKEETTSEKEDLSADKEAAAPEKDVPVIEKDVTTKADDTVEKAEEPNTKIEDAKDSGASQDVGKPAEEKPRKMKKKISRHYLVKWRGLSYEESTWELEEHLDVDKIKQFERFKDPPPKSKWRPVKRPKPEEWVRKEVSPVYKNNNTLREYQLEGINWLSFCWHQGRNCILADEMGLGKTIQSIAFINEIYQYNINGPFLIIVPLSTVGNWAREFETWTDLNVITYHGSSTSREMIKEYEMFYRNDQGNRITSYYKFQVMITTFEIILSDCLDLREIPWRCCIIDEAHRLKNRNCKLLEGLRLLNMEHRVLLTGTPLQNNVEELFSLLNFLEPSQFSSTEQFLQEFGDLKTEAQVDKLKLILKPMMLRRLKEDVEKSLAPKEETIVEVELTNIQKKYYRAILEKNFSFLSKGSTNNNMPNLMNTMMELRKCCIHPYLINGAEDQILYEAKQAKLAGGEPMNSHQAMVNSSGKLVLIDKLLPRLRADGHRVLIFSQMVRCLDILEDYVTHKHYPYERIDGRVRGSDRQQAIDRFSKPGSDRFVFLLCTRAGGLGINLTAADTVIIFDSDWNPQNDLQAQARCHRIGQSKAVKIYRLICRNTYEREMFDKASLKLGLDKAVLQSMNTQKAAGGIEGQLTKKEIEELLRKGAYGALMDDDNAGDKFCEEDIDQILLRRTQVITIDNSEAKGSTFSKATFSSSNNREDIELDDPNFWEKWAKKANIDSDDLLTKDELIQLAPRRRTQTKRYGADGSLLEMSDLDTSEEDEETISMRTRGSRRGQQPKTTPASASKRSKRNRLFDYDDDEFMANLDGGYWSKSDCLKIEDGLLTFGWGRWDEIISNNRFKREINTENCENICRVILLYCLNSYKGDEKIKSFAWELISPPEEASKLESDGDTSLSTRGRKPKATTPTAKKTIAEEISDANWPKEAKNDPLIALPDDQYRRHLQRNCNRLLIRVKFLHYLKNEILKEYHEKILTDCNVSEIDLLPVPVDGDLPADWWDDEADKSLLVGIFKHGHDRFNLIRQDPNLCFLQRCGPPNKDELIAEMTGVDKTVDDFEDDNRDSSQQSLIKIKGNKILNLKNSETGLCLDELLNSVTKELSQTDSHDKNGVVDENKNSIIKHSDTSDSMDIICENGVVESCQTTRMDITDDDSMNESSIDASPIEKPAIKTENESEFLPFPTANDLNQRFRRLITAYQRNSKKLEIKLAQKARDELKRERTSKFEAAKNEREERKRSLAQKWSRREESDFTKAISFFGVEYDSSLKRHDWNKFRSIGKLDKKLDETLEDYYKAFVVMCKKATSRPLTDDEEQCSLSVEAITEDRASKCLSRIEFFSKIREHVLTHPELDERLKLCHSQSDLPDWWENGIHDKDLLLAVAKHGLYRLDYNLAHDSTLSFEAVIKQKVEQLFKQPPSSILIPLEQLQELLDRNGIEYSKDLDLENDLDDVRAVVSSILELVEAEEAAEELAEKSFSSQLNRTSKATRSSANRPMPNILSRRGANTAVKSAVATSSGQSVRLTSYGDNTLVDRRVVEITPVLPDKIPEEPRKTHEAGEVTITIISESALLKLDDKPPVVLLGASNPITVKIRWPKDKAIQTRLENLIHLIEKNEWPTPARPPVPTITLPSHLTTPVPTSSPLTVSTTSPAKNDKTDVSLGSPKSDISNISSRASRQDTKERISDLQSTSRGRRGRGRRPKQPEPDQYQDLDSPKEDRQATAKLRNLLSQGPSSTKASSGSDKLTTKFGGNKQGAGLSSLLASFKQKRSEGESSSRDEKNLLDINNPGAGNLLPQILANMKPEFRDLLSNQETAKMLINSLTNMSGSGGVGSNLRSSSSTQASIESLLSSARSLTTTSSKGPPPAHQRSDNAPSSHGSSSTRELRRNSQNARDNSPSSVNLRSTRGKGSMSNMESLQLKSTESIESKPSSKKRGRPSSSTSDSPPGVVGADVLDLSSLPLAGKSSGSLRSESRFRRAREQSDESQSISTRSSTGVPTKASLKVGSRQQQSSSSHELEPAPDKGGRTTRASKRIGSRIDALALNLQAKRLNRSDSPELSPSLPKERSQDNQMAAHGITKTSAEHKSHSSKAPPAAHSGSHKSASSSHDLQQQREKTGQIATPTSSSSSSSNLAGRSSSSAPRADPLAQMMSNPASLLAGLNPAGLGGAGDLMNQLLRKAGTNDIVKNLLNEFMKNPSLALDPNILATLTASLPMSTQSLPGFNLPVSVPTTLPSVSTKTPTSSNNSLLNDFKSPSSNSLMKRSRQESSTTSSSRHSSSGASTMAPSESSRRSSSSTSSSTDRHERRGLSDKRASSSGSYQDRGEKHGKHEKRSNGNNQQDSIGDASSSRNRSSASLLAQQVPTSQQVSQSSHVPPAPSSQASLANAATLNLANQFGSLNSFSGLLGLPGMNELMKQMSNFPGLAAAAGLPRVSGPSVTSSNPTTSSPSVQSNNDKQSRRSRQSTAASSTPTPSISTSVPSQQQALANSLMNLASQPGAAPNPYSNYANPLANPFLPFSLANLGMNNPLGNPLGLFPNLYMPPGFPTPDQSQQQTQSTNQSGGTSDGSSKDKKIRYPRK